MQVLFANVSDVDTPYQDLAFTGFIEPQQQSRERRLSTASATNYPENLASTDIER